MATAGTLESVIDRRVSQWQAVSGIVKAFKEPPAQLLDAQLPAVVIETTEPVTRTRYMTDTLITTRRLTETVYVRKVGAHLSDTPIGTSYWGLIDTIDAAFFRDDRLNDSSGDALDGVIESTPPNDAGFQILPYGDDGAQYVAIRFVSDVRIVRVISS